MPDTRKNNSIDARPKDITFLTLNAKFTGTTQAEKSSISYHVCLPARAKRAKRCTIDDEICILVLLDVSNVKQSKLLTIYRENYEYHYEYHHAVDRIQRFGRLTC